MCSRSFITHGRTNESFVVVGAQLQECVCVCVCRFRCILPLGVFTVNSGSKQNVSSGLPAAGLNGGCSSLLYSVCTHTHTHAHTHTR